jgi:hypothetical protein
LDTELAASPSVSLAVPIMPLPSFSAVSAFERTASPAFWVYDFWPSVATLARVRKVERAYLAWLHGTSCAIKGARDAFLGLVQSALVAVRSKLLLDLLAKTLASIEISA